MIPKAVQTALDEHLLKSFSSTAEMNAYWQQSGTQLVLGAVPKDLTPEYSDPLPLGYSISLVINSDAGEGTYYLTKEQL